MVDKICLFLLKKIRKEMPEIDDERSEVIMYGLQLIIGEIPKIFVILGLSYILGIFKLTLLSVLLILPYRNFSGGFHLHTHIGCIVTTTAFYCGIALLGKYLVLGQIIKYCLALFVWIFGMIMVKLYAPADTENVPILRKKERRQKQILSYISLTIGLIVAVIINIEYVSTILIFGYLIQSISISKIAYKITNCKYGYEVYQETSLSS